MKVRCRFKNIFLQEAAEISLRTSLRFILALLCEFTPKWQVKVFSHHHLSNLEHYFNQLAVSEQSLIGHLYIVTYICDGLEDLCISAIGICSACCLGFSALSPVIQKFWLYFLLYCIPNLFDRFHGLKIR